MKPQRKSAVKGQKQTPANNKKVLETELKDMDMDFDESDSDDSESDKQEKQKAPIKTPKGKQGDKRLSFQIPGKNTPVKMAQAENSIGKKQLTPKSLKGFDGMTTNSAKKNGTKRPADDDDEEEDDDDDDEEDDDDNDDDEENDDDDDEEDDNDDDDDDDDDEEAEVSNNVQSTKILEKTPAKIAETPKQDSKGEFPQKAEKTMHTPKVGDRDANKLFIGNLPRDISETEIKSLSADIINVTLPGLMGRRRSKFAFVEFANEAKTEENFEMLKTKKLRGELMRIDYAGRKSVNLPVNKGQKLEREVNLKKLFVSSLPLDVNIIQVAALFPKSFQILLSPLTSKRNASVNFSTEEDAAEALETCKSATINDMPITVQYSFYTDRKKNEKQSWSKSIYPAAKRIKTDEI